MRIRIDLAYDGAPFHGFAKQPDPSLPTVQDVLDDALGRLLGVAVETTCAGRTDRGVHALAQVVHVDVDPSTDRATTFVDDLDATRDRLDAMTGPAITVWSVTAVDEDFHARFSPIARVYRYRLVDGHPSSPLERHHAWRVGETLDVSAMSEAARLLLGEHDFASFCRKAEGRHTVRRLDRIEVARPVPDRVEIVLDGPAFCHQQVRSIVGCLAEVGRGRRAPSWIGEVLRGKDRGLAPAVAPPEGLVLETVRFGDRWPDAPLIPPSGVDR